jgi:hypothetical protein
VNCGQEGKNREKEKNKAVHLSLSLVNVVELVLMACCTSNWFYFSEL